MKCFNIILGDYGNSSTSLSSSCSSSDSVNVIFTVLWHIEIQYKIDVWDIKTTRGYICSDQNWTLSSFEFIKRCKSLNLSQLTIDVDSFEIKIPHSQGKSCRLSTCSREYDCFLTCEHCEQVYQIGFLMFRWDENIVLN